MKKWILSAAIALATLLSPSLALAQPAPVSVRWYPLASGYNPSSVSYIYCAPSSASGTPEAIWHHSTSRVVTSGSSTTVTALSSTTMPFQQIFAGTAANYILRFNLNGVLTYRQVTAAASAISITVDSAVDLGTTGLTFDWALVNQCGTAATDGWFSVSGVAKVEFIFQIDTLGSTSIDRIVQCKGEGPRASPITAVAAANYTATGGEKMTVSTQWAQCRLGVKVNTDGADSLTYNAYLIR
jgi:hypothetical protein